VSQVHPPEQETYVVDGARLLVREVRPEDKALFRTGMAGLSRRSRFQRFFTATPALTEAALRYFTEVDGVDHHAVIAVAQRQDGTFEPVGTARFVRLAPPRTDAAEFAVTILDAWQGRGISGILLGRLIRAAQARGVRTFVADVLVENQAMLSRIGFLAADCRLTFDDGVVHIEFEINDMGLRLAEGSGQCAG
jgi:RimJ/RimL family protein N-acetyltransferase